MGHFAFVAPPFLGHLNPTLALARALRDRGHRTTVFGIADIVDTVRVQGAGFVPLGCAAMPAGTLQILTDHLAAPHGLGLIRVLGDMARMTRMLCHEMPAACRVAGIDGIVTDQFEAAGGFVARHLGLPYVSVANALPVNREPAVPPLFTDWAYDPSRRGLRRNRGGYRVADLMMRPLRRAAAREAGRLGIGHDDGALPYAVSPLADLTQIVPELDFPRLHRAPVMQGCGPLRPPEDDPIPDDLRGDGQPLVFASLGTLQGGRIGLLRMIAEACAQLDLHLVLAHGGRLPPEAAAALPGRPVVRAFVPQRSLLRQAALAITNGGLNTVLDAAAAGVPVLVIPIAFEQGATAARVVRAGIGAALARRRLTPDRLRTAIATLIDDPAVKARAAAMAVTLAAAGGAAAAAAIVEKALETGRPVLRTDTAAPA